MINGLIAQLFKSECNGIDLIIWPNYPELSGTSNVIIIISNV